MHKKDIRLEEICTREDLLEGYQRECAGEKAIAALDEHNIFPVTLANPQTEVVTALGLYTHFAGSLLITSTGKAMGEIGDTYVPKFQDRWKETLGLTFQKSQGNYRFSQNGSFFVRLLAAMGFHFSDADPPLSKKALTGSRLPEYLTRLVYQHEHLGRASQSRANVYLKDMIAVWFHTRGQVTGNTSIRARILSQPTKEKIDAEAQFFVDAMNCVYPGVGLTMNDCDRRASRRDGEFQGYYSGHFTFTIDHLLRLPRHTRSPMTYQAVITPKLGFEYEKSGQK